MNIGQALLKARKDREIRQNVVSSGIGITQTYLSQIETGQKIPSFEVVEKICSYYKMPLAIMMWFAISEKDVKKDKQFAFKKVKPSIDALINEIFN